MQPGRRRFPFWAGWLVLIGGASVFHLAISPLPVGQSTGYQCSRNDYNCSEFRSRLQAQAAYLACGAPATTCMVSTTTAMVWPASVSP